MSHYYHQDDLKKIPELVQLAPRASSSFLAFEQEVYTSTGAIPLKTKELIAVAVAHVTGCPYCIDTHVQRYKELGGTPEEIVEAVLVAATTRAGAVLSHATQALIAFNRPHPLRTIEGNGSTEPECFC
ncbi:carboxymuconolactone decarboxylase family protein [Brevibacillus nitrificans]|uniref:carboxymuconolactone decarboxylase family protein n=1 Tax=Brevibacillus TaxID=55080 RepID=UPI0028563CAC|nr:carboxymuconolactone decarboxylase family protein [Brevibacillus nitrificans]MDR7315659.1 AhpD family alkylhydroperoxidase [Brevibacillus nitrificans]